MLKRTFDCFFNSIDVSKKKGINSKSGHHDSKSSGYPKANQKVMLLAIACYFEKSKK